MGQKVNPHGLRVGVIKDWDSKWYAEGDFADYLVEDYNIRTFLKKMNEECHTTIILTSHDMDDISSVCDELIVIDKGKIILQESMDVILSKFSDFKYLKIKMTLDLVPELCSVKGVVVISQTKSECILKIPRDFVFETLESINKLVDIEDFEISNLSLEEIILQNYFTKKEHN